MFSKNNLAVYRRLLVLGLLSICVLYFGYADKVETVKAASACQQDCDRYYEMCTDNCASECDSDSSDTDCNSCLYNCALEWNDCSEHSIYCTSGTVSYSPVCSVDFGIHCPWDSSNGIYNCGQGWAHNGYFETCDRIGYEDGCIECPSGEQCCPFGGCGPGDPPPCL
jgi:hypothetical protein